MVVISSIGVFLVALTASAAAVMPNNFYRFNARNAGAGNTPYMPVNNYAGYAPQMPFAGQMPFGGPFGGGMQGGAPNFGAMGGPFGGRPGFGMQGGFGGPGGRQMM